MFDINDFDETLPGPWEWDVKRLAASFEIAGRDRGFGRPSGGAIVLGARRPSTASAMREVAAHANLDVWYAHVEVETSSERVRARSSSRKAEPSAPRRRSPRRGRGTACRRSPSSPTRSTASGGSSRDPPLIVPIEELVAGRRARRASRGAARPAQAYRATLGDRPAAAAGGLRLRPHRPQGGRCRQRRHPRLDRAAARPRRPGPAVPAGEGGAGVGARGVRRQERVPQPRPAGGRRPAPDAGGQRHLPRLAAGRPASTAGPRLLHAPAAGLEGLGRRRAPWLPQGMAAVRASCAAGRWPAPTPAPATGSPSPPTSATATPSTGRSPTSPRPTPTRTNATTRRSSTRSPAAGRGRDGSVTEQLLPIIRSG